LTRLFLLAAVAAAAIGSASASTCTTADIDAFDTTKATHKGYDCVAAALGPKFAGASLTDVFGSPTSLLSNAGTQATLIFLFEKFLNATLVGQGLSPVYCSQVTPTTTVNSFASSIDILCPYSTYPYTLQGEPIQALIDLATNVFEFLLIQQSIPAIAPCLPAECKPLALAICNSNGTIPGTVSKYASDSLFVKLSAGLSQISFVAGITLTQILSTPTTSQVQGLEKAILGGLNITSGTFNCTTLVNAATFAPATGSTASLVAGAMGFFASMAALVLV